MLAKVVAVVLVGVVIKLIDDYLDEPEESLSMAGWLGRGVAAYGLLLFAIAVSLVPGMAVTLFLAAYAVGMVKDPFLRLPTALHPWFESLLVFLLGSFLWGWSEMASSFIVICFVQLLDDYCDKKEDEFQQVRNLVLIWGEGEVLLLGLATGYLAIVLDWQKALLVTGATYLINLAMSSFVSRRRS